MIRGVYWIKFMKYIANVVGKRARHNNKISLKYFDQYWSLDSSKKPEDFDKHILLSAQLDVTYKQIVCIDHL